MIKKSETEMRAEEARLRGLAMNDNAPQEIQRQADCAAHALNWAIATDAGSVSAADRLEAMLPGPPPDGAGVDSGPPPSAEQPGPEGAAEPVPA